MSTTARLNSMIQAIALDAADNVAVAVQALERGSAVVVAGHVVLITEPIPAGHKFARLDIAHDAAIRKYNEVIGRASSPIAAGNHVHVHNVTSDRLPGPDDD
jgi:altronate dehydratase